MIPKLADSEVMDALRPVLEQGGELSAFEARRLQRQIDAIIKADAPQGYLLKAYLAATQWDCEGGDAAARNAIRLMGDAAMHYCVSGVYTSLIDLDKAVKHAEAAAIGAPSIQRYAVGAVDLNMYAGWWLKALDFAERHLDAVRRAGGEGLDAAIKQRDTMARAVSDYEQLGMPWQRLRFELNAATLLLKRQRLRFLGQALAVGVDPDSNEPYLAYQLRFDGTMENELALEAEMAQIVSSEPGWNPDRLSIEFSHRERLVASPA